MKEGGKKQISINLLESYPIKNEYSAMVKPAKHIALKDKIILSDDLYATVTYKSKSSGYIKIIFNQSHETLLDYLKEIGAMPLPPYIKRESNHLDQKDYQTVFAKNIGAVAAPTAGLHFTKDLLNSLQKNVSIAYLTLHVGGGTFLPVKSENIEQHVMHEELYSIDSNACKIINNAKAKGGKVICVGTTTIRVLESIAINNNDLTPQRGKTDIFIKPGYNFKIADSLITNFHLPKSTLFMLVCAFAGISTIKKTYNHAIQNDYRFFSYGDACFIERRV